jgi:hypothetical protein
MSYKLMITTVFLWVALCICILFAYADEGVTTTISDDSEDTQVAEYSLPINQQQTKSILETEYKEVKQEKVIEQKVEPILPTGYSILVKDEPFVMEEKTHIPVWSQPSMWIRVKCQKLEEKQVFFQANEFDVIHGKHEQEFKNWR